MTTTIIELLRHGEVDGEEVFRGSTDVPLSKAGWEQMSSALQHTEETDIVISSPLLRCQEFAKTITDEKRTPLLSDMRLQEIDFGNWEDCSPDQILETDAKLLHEWWNKPTSITPPDGESFQHFRYRVLEFWHEILTQYKDNRILLITHAGVIRIVLMKILGMQEENLFRLDVGYANLTRIRIHHDETGDWASLISHG